MVYVTLKPPFSSTNWVMVARSSSSANGLLPIVTVAPLVAAPVPTAQLPAGGAMVGVGPAAARAALDPVVALPELLVAVPLAVPALLLVAPLAVVALPVAELVELALPAVVLVVAGAVLAELPVALAVVALPELALLLALITEALAELTLDRAALVLPDVPPLPDVPVLPQAARSAALNARVMTICGRFIDPPFTSTVPDARLAGSRQCSLLHS
ncbi:MAG: hypothetical protein ACR2JY_14850 [Chloroflexota bacterium]